MQSHAPPAMNLSSAAIICVLKPNIKIPMKAPDFISDDGTATIVGKCVPRIFRMLHVYARYVHMICKCVYVYYIYVKMYM